MRLNQKAYGESHNAHGSEPALDEAAHRNHAETDSDTRGVADFDEEFAEHEQETDEEAGDHGPSGDAEVPDH